MKCLACGREMVKRGTHFVCTNFLCDYLEDIEIEEVVTLAFCFGAGAKSMPEDTAVKEVIR